MSKLHPVQPSRRRKKEKEEEGDEFQGDKSLERGHDSAPDNALPDDDDPTAEFSVICFPTEGTTTVRSNVDILDF